MANGTVAHTLPMNTLNLTGLAFGRLIALDYVPRHKNSAWRCRCQCGREITARADHLLQGRSRSCGCLRTEMLVTRSVTHGATRRRDFSREYLSWASMRKRCNNPKERGYGARGITVCDRWDKSFEAFLADMGPRPAGMTIDRIDNERGYYPGNCRWASVFTQNRNRRTTRFLTHNGVTMCLTDWAQALQMPRTALVSRLDKGWTVERALTSPHRSTSRRSAR